MKRLLKYLSPFAPDQSGAVSALFELGGLMVICDAGGCTGNICGFDEPRWFTRKSALFSAGLRDMDAIFGRDDLLIRRVAEAAELLHPPFIAYIGTPVPAVIATDFSALRFLTEKRTNIPCIAVPTTGTNQYDKGAEEAFRMLFQTFATEKLPVISGRIGLLGATPLDLTTTDATDFRNAYGTNTVSYGMGSTLDDCRQASCAEKNIVLSPAGLSSAKLLQRLFGTPYECDFPILPSALPKDARKVLIVHQQIAANALRNKLRGQADCTVATWFQLLPTLTQPGDFHIRDEEHFQSIANDYDAIVADDDLRHALPDYHGQWFSFPHFAVSGQLPSP